MTENLLNKSFDLTMKSPAQKMAALVASPEYETAVNLYSNGYVNGAAMQRPDSVGFKLWLLFSIHMKANGAPPSRQIAEDLAREHGLNTTSATNALGKWSAYYGLRPPRSGAYASSPANCSAKAISIEKSSVENVVVEDAQPEPQPLPLVMGKLVRLKKHNERCSDCKNTIIEIFRSLYGQVKVDHKIDVGVQIADHLNNPLYEDLHKLYEALEANRGHRGFVRLKKLHRCDLFVPALNSVVEFDESQHFSRARMVSLLHYPEELKLGFDPKTWIALCEKIDAKDNDPEDRDEQRAWYDTMRDFLPVIAGLNPTIRIHMAAHDWCSLDAKNPRDVELFKLKSAYSKPDISLGDSLAVTTIATVNIESYGEYDNDTRTKLLEGVLEKLNGKASAVVLPAGFYKVQENASSAIYTFAESVRNLLKKRKDDSIVSFGIDGRGAKDQIAVAVCSEGILGAGRKFHPTDVEKGSIELATSYIDGDSGFPRIININGNKIFLAVCFDSYGIRQRELINPDVQFVFNYVHSFNPRGEVGSGESYFARHGFAGAAKQWCCPVFGAAVFFNRTIPSEWPTGVIWNQGEKSTKEWHYSDNPLLPKNDFRVHGDSFNEISVVRMFTI